MNTPNPNRRIGCYRIRLAIGLCAFLVIALLPTILFGQADAPPPDTETIERRGPIDLIIAGGPVGFAVIGLSLVGTALVVDAFLKLKPDDLIPPSLSVQAYELAKQGRFGELMRLSQASDSVLGRVLGEALAEGSWGIEAVREGVEQAGRTEITRLHQRNGYIGLIGAVAPMLGLLGTVTGMIMSFQLLGDARGSATPDELAVGISQALVTTCMGLIVALPMMFFHTHFRNRINRIGHEASKVCEKVLRIMAVVQEARKVSNAKADGDGVAARPPQSVTPQSFNI